MNKNLENLNENIAMSPEEIEQDAETKNKQTTKTTTSKPKINHHFIKPQEVLNESNSTSVSNSSSLIKSVSSSSLCKNAEHQQPFDTGLHNAKLKNSVTTAKSQFSSGYR